MKDKEHLYKFILRLALTFRLSLKNICKLQGLEPTLENQMKIYNSIDELFSKDIDLKRAYDYLFNYETLNENDKLSIRSLGTANIFLAKYREIAKLGNKDDILKIDSNLEKLDGDFRQLEKGIDISTITDEDIVTISKYRLKYAISRERICDVLGISRDSLALREERLTNEVLKQKLKTLSNFYLDVINMKRNVK